MTIYLGITVYLQIIFFYISRGENNEFVYRVNN